MRTISIEKSRELAAIAARLPKVMKRDSEGEIMVADVDKVSGERLLQAGIKTHYGETVVFDKLYRLRKPQYEDHRLNLIYNYRRDGDKAVNAYIKRMQRQAWNDLPMKKKLLALVWTLRDKLLRKRKSRTVIRDSQ